MSTVKQRQARRIAKLRNRREGEQAATEAWRSIQRMFDEHEVRVQTNHDLVDAVREANGYRPIEWPS